MAFDRNPIAHGEGVARWTFSRSSGALRLPQDDEQRALL